MYRLNQSGKSKCKALALALMGLLAACSPAATPPSNNSSDNVAITIIYAPTVMPTDAPESRSAVLAPLQINVPVVSKIADTGLIWRECAIAGNFQAEQAATCFGALETSADTTFAERLGDPFTDDLKLKIVSDTYRTTKFKSDYFPDKQCFNLHKNTSLQYTLCGVFTGFTPNYSLQNIGDKWVWEFIDTPKGYVIVDGKDVAPALSLDGAYRPYGIDGKLIFIGKKDDKQFVVYNGQIIRPEFDQIHIAYCCEPVLWSVRYAKGKYWFWGKRNGQSYVVEISAQQ